MTAAAASLMLLVELATSSWIARWTRNRSRFSLPWVAYTLRSSAAPSVHVSQSVGTPRAAVAHEQDAWAALHDFHRPASPQHTLQRAKPGHRVLEVV